MVVEIDFTAFSTTDWDTLTILDNDGFVLSQERSGDCLPPKMWSRTNVVHLQGRSPQICTVYQGVTF